MPDARAPTAYLIAWVRSILAMAVAAYTPFAMFSPVGFATVLFFVYFVHIGFATYEGRFSRRRTWSWIVLVPALFFAQIIVFSGYFLPWGWLTPILVGDGTQLPQWLIGPLQFVASPTGRDFLTVVVLPLAWLFLALDWLFDWLDWRGEKRAGLRWPGIIFILVTLFLGWGVGLMWRDAGAFSVGKPSLPSILPQWYVSPAYAVLRCIPDKLGGVIAMLAVMLVPILLPWLTSPRYRLPPLRSWFQGACLLFALGWIGLCWLGRQPPEGVVIWLSQALTTWYFAFFIVVLPIFAIWSRRRAKAEAAEIARAFD
ncbi:hypothetical protein [Labrys sp. 22185]|uniref:cytochrome b n=1 Tax=Labrys sp. 22185 TaxID=3453888 RepID=UPI003F84B7E9